MYPTVPAATTRRGLMLHDGLAVLTLLAVSLALLGVTLFLFKSFEAHRDELAHRWSERGRLALEQGHADEAVGALRAALNYAPDDRQDQLLLARALAAAGHAEEADNYFLNLWSTRPGDGFLNLQLARLARSRNQLREATDYYRASVFGSWEGDGVLRRREVRLELADFLVAQHQPAEARNELFTVAGNSPDNLAMNLTVAGRLEAAGFPSDALIFYRKALVIAPRSRLALAHAGQLAWTVNDYSQAETWLNRALDQKPDAAADAPSDAALAALAQQAHRIQQLSLAPGQTLRHRADHVTTAARLARARLAACLNPANPGLAQLESLWNAALSSARTLPTNSDTQDNWGDLVYRTELETAATCGPPTGDDALLLKLAHAARKEAANGN